METPNTEHSCPVASRQPHHHHHHHHHHILLPSQTQPTQQHNRLPCHRRHHHHHLVMLPHCCALHGYPPPPFQRPTFPSTPSFGDQGNQSSQVFEQEDAYEQLEEEEEEDPIFVLTDEWRDFFAKSEAKRREAKKKARKQGNK